MYSVLNTLSLYIYFYILKDITSYAFLLVFKIVQSFQYILKFVKITLNFYNFGPQTTKFISESILIVYKYSRRLLTRTLSPKVSSNNLLLWLMTSLLTLKFTAWKVSKYGLFSDPYFPAFGLNTGKYGPDKTPYLDTFHKVILIFSNLILPNFILVSKSVSCFFIRCLSFSEFNALSCKCTNEPVPISNT